MSRISRHDSYFLFHHPHDEVWLKRWNISEPFWKIVSVLLRFDRTPCRCIKSWNFEPGKCSPIRPNVPYADAGIVADTRIVPFVYSILWCELTSAHDMERKYGANERNAAIISCIIVCMPRFAKQKGYSSWSTPRDDGFDPSDPAQTVFVTPSELLIPERKMPF